MHPTHTVPAINLYDVFAWSLLLRLRYRNSVKKPLGSMRSTMESKASFPTDAPMLLELQFRSMLTP